MHAANYSAFKEGSYSYAMKLTFIAAFLITSLAASLQIAGTVTIHCILRHGCSVSLQIHSIAVSFKNFNVIAKTSTAGKLLPLAASINFAFYTQEINKYITYVTKLIVVLSNFKVIALVNHEI